MTRGPRFVTLVPLIVVALGCHIEEPFARDNPWDPGGTALMVLTGPESTFAIGDTFSVVLTSDPPLPPGLLNVVWESTGTRDTAVQVVAAGYGKFVVNRAHAEYQLAPVAVRFEDGNVLGKDAAVGTFVWIGQRLATFDMSCGTVAAPIACDATPLAVNGLRTVNSTMRDANGNDIRRREGIMRRATVVVRDPAVCSTIQSTINAAGAWTLLGSAPGATWLVITADGVRDSVRVVVGP